MLLSVRGAWGLVPWGPELLVWAGALWRFLSEGPVCPTWLGRCVESAVGFLSFAGFLGHTRLTRGFS
jgi:hypothetical protein